MEKDRAVKTLLKVTEAEQPSSCKLQILMLLCLDDFVIFIVFLLHIIVLNPNFFISANLCIAAHSEPGYSARQVEGYRGQEKSRDIAGLVCDNNFDTLSHYDKYIGLKNRFVPEAIFDFPKTIKHGCNRSCKSAYFSDCFVYYC